MHGNTHKGIHYGSSQGGPKGDPSERPVPAPRAIQLTVKYQSFKWEGNTHEQQRTEILMEGPYEDYKEPDKVAAILGWLGDKGHQVYAP